VEIKKKSASVLLFLIGFALLPVNNAPWFMSLNTIFRAPSELFFLLSLIAYMLQLMLINTGKYKLHISKSQFLFVGMLLSFVFISMIINIEYSGAITNSSALYGLNRMFMSSLIWLKLLLFLLFFIHMINSIDLKLLTKYIVFGFRITTIYAFLEIIFYILPSKLGYSVDTSFMLYLESFIHYNDHMPFLRIRGMAFEPSYLVPILVFILPFLILNKPKSKFNMDIIALLIILWFAYSPTGLIAVSIFYILYRFQGVKLFLTFILLLFIGFILIIFVLNGIIVIPIEHMDSTAIRTGSWYSALVAISQNPFFGVGPGMYGYWCVFNYPDYFWGTNVSDAFYFLGVDKFAGTPFASLLTVGLSFGLVPILALLIYLYINKYFQYIWANNIVRASFFSLIISSMGIDGYVLLVFWIYFAILLTKKITMADLNNEK